MTGRAARRRLATGALLVMLAACGSDGTESGMAPPLAAPSPSPTPTPTPTPSPTPASYDLGSDFSRNRSFTAIGSTMVFTETIDGGAVSSIPSGATIEPASTAIGFDFTNAARRYVVRYNGASIDVATNAVDGGNFTYDEFDAEDGTGTSGRHVFRAPFTPGAAYTGLLLWFDRQGDVSGTSGRIITIRRLIFGAPTVSSDLPTSGIVRYRGNAGVSERTRTTFRLPALTGGVHVITTTLDIDWATRRLTGNVSVFPPSGTGSTLQSPQLYTIDGTVGTSGRLTGSVIGNGYTGLLEGTVFGPQGVELGFAFTLAGTCSGDPRACSYVGDAIARRE